MSYLAVLIESSLGYPLDQETLTALEMIQARHWTTHDALNALLEAGILSPDAYLARLATDLGASMLSYRLLLGDAQFDRIFGEAGRHPEGIIDRTIFLRSLKNE